MRTELSAYAQLHAVLPASQPASLPSFNFSFFKSRGFFAGALSLVLIVATGGQAAFASEKALPGDILYPVKVTVAEPLALALAPAGEVKAELSTRFAGRRIEEAAKLSELGTLTNERAEELAVRFEAHIDTADKEAQILESRGDISTSLAIRADLEQGINEQVESLVPSPDMAVAFAAAPAEESVMMSAKMAVTAPVEDAAIVQTEETPASRFFSRIDARTRAFADARLELENALAVHVEPSTDVGAGLAVVDAANLLPEENDDSLASARVLSPAVDAVALTEATTSLMLATMLATSTPTTTPEEIAPAAKTGSPASRFFAPFFLRDREDK